MKVKNWIVRTIASGFFSGYFPLFPGTVGSLGGVIIFLFLNAQIYIPVVALLFFLGVWISAEAEKVFGEKDSKKIVIDEITGYLVAMFALPFNFMVAGFLLFRLFDWWKPFPLRKVHRNFKGGGGVMLDDILAGIYTNIILQVFRLMR